ncbi:hypothetical protein Hanom_Chr13g01194261 [Helianthus anomalus]
MTSAAAAASPRSCSRLLRRRQALSWRGCRRMLHIIVRSDLSQNFRSNLWSPAGPPI